MSVRIPLAALVAAVVLCSVIGFADTDQLAVITGTLSTYSDTPVEGAVVFAGTSSGTCDAEGRYRISVQPGKHSVIPLMPGWQFIPQCRVVTVGPGQIKRLDFVGQGNGSIAGKVVLTTPARLAPSRRGAGPGAQVWLVAGVPGAESMRIRFERVALPDAPEDCSLSICDQSGSTVATYAGPCTLSSIISSPVPGNEAIIKLRGAPLHDDTEAFKADYCLCTLAGIKVFVEPSGQSAFTDAEGRYEIRDLKAGYYIVKAERDGWAFSPASHTVRVTDGTQSSEVDFIGQAAAPPANNPRTNTDQEREALSSGFQATDGPRSRERK